MGKEEGRGDSTGDCLVIIRARLVRKVHLRRWLRTFIALFIVVKLFFALEKQGEEVDRFLK